MGTRSVSGVRINGQDKLSYNHSDGSFKWVGQDIVDEIKAAFSNPATYDETLAKLRAQAEALVLVDAETLSLPAHRKLAKRSGGINLDVSSRKVTDNYCLFRNHQGTILKRLSVGVATNELTFIKESDCEYAYILDLDSGWLEVYKNLQLEKPHNHGRYGMEKVDGWYGVALIDIIPIKSLAEVSDLDSCMAAPLAAIEDIHTFT